MIQCYAPTDTAELQDKGNFYSQLNAAVHKIPKGDIKILMGDFNAKVGSDNSDHENVMGRHGLGKMSENGELFAEIFGNNDMVIGGSLFPHRPVHKVTWVSRNGVTENRNGTFFLDNKRSANIASDHHLLIGEIRLRIARIHR